jgi:hypothetical protein
MSIQKELPANQLNNFVRMLFRADTERVMVLRNATFLALRRLGVKRDQSKAVSKIPDGTDQIDLGSAITWMDGIVPEDTVAVSQIVVLDATAVFRTS